MRGVNGTKEAEAMLPDPEAVETDRLTSAKTEAAGHIG
jgi:hypothetical protein